MISHKVACDLRQSMLLIFPATDAPGIHLLCRPYGNRHGPALIHHILAPDAIGRFITLLDRPDPSATLHCARGRSTITARPETGGGRTVLTFTSPDDAGLSFICGSFQSQAIRGLVAALDTTARADR